MAGRTGTWKPRKMALAAGLLAVFAFVVFSSSPEWVAWQGPLVMGSLQISDPVRGDLPVVQENGDSRSMFEFLGFLSTAGILGVSWKKILLYLLPPP